MDYEKGLIQQAVIYDMSGKVMKNFQGQNIQQVEVYGLPSGMYVISLKTNDGWVRRLLPVKN